MCCGSKELMKNYCEWQVKYCDLSKENEQT